MVKKLKNLITSLSIISLFAVPILAPVAVSAQSQSQTDINNSLKCGANLDATQIGSSTTTDCEQGGTDAGTRVNNIIHLVINIFSLVVGVVSVIMIIIGGLKYITSGGDSGNITGAKNTILYAIIGLVVVALAQVVVRFVLQKATQ